MILKCFDYYINIYPGAQPALHLWGWGAVFMNFHLMTSSCLFIRGATFSQTVTDKVLFATFLK